MILEILAVAAGALAGTAVGAWIRRRRRAREPAKPKPAPRPPRTEGDVRVGDAVLHLGDDFVVVTETRFEEEGRAFVIWTAESEGRIRFLLTESGASRTTSWLASIETPVPGRPPDRHRHGDVDFRLRARGRANATREGADGPVPEGEVDWARFGGPGRSAMLVVTTKDDALWMVGEEVLPGMVEVLPGS